MSAATESCPGGCGRTFYLPALGCSTCVKRVPATLMHRVVIAEGERDVDLQVEAERDVLRWLRDHPAPAAVPRAR